MSQNKVSQVYVPLSELGTYDAERKIHSIKIMLTNVKSDQVPNATFLGCVRCRLLSRRHSNAQKALSSSSHYSTATFILISLFTVRNANRNPSDNLSEV